MTTLDINVEAMVDFLVGLLNTPSPTGYHVEAIDFVRRAFDALEAPGLEAEITNKGALVLTWKGQARNAPRALTAHVDTLGLMVKEIKSSGRIRATRLGGYMWTAVEFEGVTVRTHDNTRYRGTMLPVNPSVHVNSEISDTKRKEDTMEIRLDARTTSAEETRALGIEVGDFVFLDPRVEVTDTGFIRSRHLDDKAGVAVIYGAVMALKGAGVLPAQDTTILITNYEEAGHGGSSGLPTGLAELLAVDMGAIGEGQATDEFSASICVKDSTGPYHFEMTNKLRRLAAAHEIPAKLDIYPNYGSDGSTYWRAGGEARVGLIGPGVDASHAYERTHREALQHTAHLIARYLLDAGA
ncbi:MAG: M42 family metallopeptidase [Anaerolineae bacterium]